MATYINKNWTARNHDCINVIMQTTDGAPLNFNGSSDDAGNWVEVNAQEIADIEELTGTSYADYKGFSPIGGFAQHSFFGYM